MTELTKDMHKGETCIIIGNGPSLNDIPDELLLKYPTFGTNKIWKKKGFTPTYYVAINPLPIEQSIKQINRMKAVKFIRWQLADKIKGAYPLISSGTWQFSQEPLKWIFEGFTVTYVCMQLAFWMGFDTVLLVGVDHNYTFDGQPNELLIAKGENPNHFDPTYFSDAEDEKGNEWHAPDLNNSERAYEIAKRTFNRAGRRIINLTTRTALEVFPRDDYMSWMGKEG